MAARLLVVAVGLALAIRWISNDVGWGKLGAAFRALDLRLFVLVLCIFMSGSVIIAIRWWLLLRTQSIHIEITAAIKLLLLGLFYNNFMPSSVGGDILRAWYITRHTDKKFEAALSVFLDRIVGLASTLVIAAFFYTLFLSGRGLKLTPDISGISKLLADNKGILLAVLGGITVVFGLISAFERGRMMLRKVWLKAAGRAITLWHRLRSAVVLYFASPLTVLAVFGLTVAMQISVITGFWLLGRDIGIEASVKYYYVFFTLTWVLGAVPISIGGAVLVEGMLVTFFVRFAGVDRDLALTLALCQRLVWMISSLPGGVIHLVGAHLPKDFSVDYGDAIQ
jgi:uncharacterized protein (TIRG00374 family)